MKKNKLKKITKLFLLLFLTTIFISCQKEVDDFDNIVNPPAVINDSIYLDKIYVVNAGAVIDTQGIYSFTYDVQKRITGWILTDVATGPYISYTYYYNGTDTVPFKSLFIDYDSPIPDTTITFHSYDANGRNLQDSSYSVFPSMSNSIISTYKYSYAPGKRYCDGKIENFQPTSIISLYRDTATLDASGNILTCIRYTDAISGTMELFSNANYTYDNKATPFARQNIFRAHQNFISNEEILLYEYMPYNQMLSYQETFVLAGTTPINGNLSVIYNSNNLPVKSTQVEGTQTSILQYTYKPL